MWQTKHEGGKMAAKLQFSFTVLDKFLHDVQKPIAHPTAGDAKRATTAVDDIINSLPLIDELNVKGLRDLIRFAENGKFADMKGKMGEAISDFQVIESFYKKKIVETTKTLDQFDLLEAVDTNDTKDKMKENPKDKKLVESPQQNMERPSASDLINVKALHNTDDSHANETNQSNPISSPFPADLDDMHRPSKLAEEFSRVYEAEWMDAFDAVARVAGKTENKEKEIIIYLNDILRNIFSYTVKRSLALFDNIALLLEQTMLDPVSSTKEKIASQSVVYKNRFQRYAKTCVKETAKLSIPALIKDFKQTDMRPALQKHIDIFNVNKYIDKCMEMCWFMNVVDPPMSLKWPSESQKVEDLMENFRYYTKSGIQLDYCVWPALLFYEKGTVVVKGVIQMQ